MKLLAYIRTVLWSFIGVGSGAANSEDRAKVKPLGLLGVAAVLLALIGFAIFGLATLAVRFLS